jgi:hypothetical protein
MNSYKRNQIHDAIAALDRDRKRTDAELLTRMKRLLEADRALGRSKRSRDPEQANYAFYSDEPPGTGVEIWFSEYEAFALFTALRVLEHGFPQGIAVRILRRVRRQLEAQHPRILRQISKVVFGRRRMTELALTTDLVGDDFKPVFLTIISGRQSSVGDSSLSCAVCRGMVEVEEFAEREGGESWTVFELVGPAHKLSAALAKTEPRKRGRFQVTKITWR